MLTTIVSRRVHGCGMVMQWRASTRLRWGLIYETSFERYAVSEVDHVEFVAVRVFLAAINFTSRVWRPRHKTFMN
jgi:hypothetical protein